jgi:hypothetical protein
MPKIAISYRRTESDATGRIYDRLVQRYGDRSIFRDIDWVPFGIDFRKAVDEALGDADVLIAIVGPQWRGTNEDGSARITDENDLVRIEIETALKRDIPLIPVLVSGASMPKVTELPESIRDFSFRNAATIDSGRNFNTDIDRLMRSIDRLMEKKEIGRAELQRAAALTEEAERTEKKGEEERARRGALEAQERAERDRRVREQQEEAEMQRQAADDATGLTSRLTGSQGKRPRNLVIGGAAALLLLVGAIVVWSIFYHKEPAPTTVSTTPPRCGPGDTSCLISRACLVDRTAACSYAPVCRAALSAALARGVPYFARYLETGHAMWSSYTPGSSPYEQKRCFMMLWGPEAKTNSDGDCSGDCLTIYYTWSGDLDNPSVQITNIKQ